MMDLSIIICTHNNSRLLEQAIKSLDVQMNDLNTGQEIIVVDNNSKDDTAEVVKKYEDKKLKYVFERKIGLSNARNTGIKNSSGKIIAFLDDDVLVDKAWVENLLKYFDDPKAMCVGGRILPWWECSPPTWLLQGDYFYMLALLDLGEKPIQLYKPTLWGANISFRREVFSKHGNFNTKLGRKGKKLLGGEETELLNKLISAGDKILYAPDAIVRHFVQSKRMKRRYLIKYAYYNGIEEGMIKKYSYKRLFCKVPLYFYKQIIITLMDFVKSKGRFDTLLNVFFRIGNAVGFRHRLA
jgi:glycosyltransferase involved in cell wall biosynthesis